MGNGDQRLDAVFMAFIEQIVVELQPLLVRLQLVPFRKNPRPGDGRPEHLEAHLREQLDIFLIPVIKIDADQLHIVFGRHIRRRRLDAMRTHILGRPALAVLLIRPFQLIRGYRAAPEKSFRKLKFHVFSRLFRYDKDIPAS
ncbi:hypothetical protein D3C73_1262380 [compost metagenome]